MVDSDRVSSWVWTTIKFAIWFVVVIVAWRVVESLEAVRTAEPLYPPWQSNVFPMGLWWEQIIDLCFLGVLSFSVIGLPVPLHAHLA